MAQDYNNIEFIVVDGASTDGSLEIIREYEGRISTIISEPDHGMYEAINKGIRVAAGDVIGLLHSDDFFYDNGVISRIVKQISFPVAYSSTNTKLHNDCLLSHTILLSTPHSQQPPTHHVLKAKSVHHIVA